MLSATFLTASFFASFFALLAFLSGLVLVVQFLGALPALSLIASLSITLSLCASLILHSFMRIFLRSPGLSSPPKGTTPEIVRSGLSRLMSRRPWPA